MSPHKTQSSGVTPYSKFRIFHFPADILSRLRLPATLNKLQDAPQDTNPPTSQHYSTPNIDRAHEATMGTLARLATPSCNTCGGVEFETATEQRAHFKSDWHGFNMRKKVDWSARKHSNEPSSEYPWDPVDEKTFSQTSNNSNDANSSDASAWSESDNATESESDDDMHNADAALSASLVAIRIGKRKERANKSAQTPYLWFDAPGADGEESETRVFGVLRRILIQRGDHTIHADAAHVLEELVGMQLPAPVKKTQLELKADKHAASGSGSSAAADEKSSQWAILCLNGGYFAGAVFDNRSAEVVAHKTFQRYTTRRKQGGSQSRQDNATGKAAKSAGAQIRRYNEQMLQAEIHDLLTSWSARLGRCSRVFVRVARTSRKVFFGDGLLHKDDPRVRVLPVSVGRPTLAELRTAYLRLTEVQVAHTIAPDLPPSPQPAPELGPDSDTESEHTLEPEPHPSLVEFLRDTAQLFLDRKARDADIVAYLSARAETFLDALSDPAVGLRYLDERYGVESRLTPTLLHLASHTGRAGVIAFLLDHGDDPTTTNGHPPMFSGGRTAYEIAKDRETRDAFRRYRAGHEREVDGVDWERARVPEALTAEREKERDERTKERRRREREKRKARERKRKAKQGESKANEEVGERQSAVEPAAEAKRAVADMTEGELRMRMLSMAYASAGGSWNASASRQPERPASPETRRRIDRELRFNAVQRRLGANVCAHCGKALEGVVPFEQFDWKCCSMQCLRAHRELHSQ